MKDLETIGLSWDTVYVQNLCRNYFARETSKNRKIWLDAVTYWIPALKEELSKFDTSIPVLLTSDILFSALVTCPEKYSETVDFYECRQPIPIKAEHNHLERSLIPFYRGSNGRTRQSYRLSSGNWSDYRVNIIRCMNSSN